MFAANRWAYVRKTIAALAVVTFAVGVLGSAAQARADRLDREARFEIPAQSLATALVQFAKQAEVQLVTSSVELGSRETSGISGRLSVRRALESLLDRTGLAFTLVGENTVAIGPAAEATGLNGGALSGSNLSDRTPSSPQGTGGAETAGSDVARKPGFWNRRRLAQNEGGRESEDSVAVQQDNRVPRSSAVDVSSEALGEIVVTGTNIRGVYPASSPVQVYTAEDIARTGATTTEQFVQKLPQNLGTRTQYAAGFTASEPNRESVNVVDLRGLGVGTTLVLLNGRRLALASQGQAADISMIPVSALERVEVLSDGASAIYGSDAIGGVINFVMRRDFDDIETLASYGGVTDGSLRQTDVTQTFGHQWNSGHGLVSYNYYSASALQVLDRDYARAAGPGMLTPKDGRHNALATFSQDVADRLTVGGDFAFAKRDTRNANTFAIAANPASRVAFTSNSQTKQYFGNLDFDYRLGESLHASMLTSYSTIDVNNLNVSRNLVSGAPTTTRFDTEYSALDITGMLDGPLCALPAGQVSFSVGAGYLNEESVASGSRVSPDLGRITTYLFGELHVPLVAVRQNILGVHRLELSLAARYTNYDDASTPALAREFGDGTNPKVGLLWALSPSFALRGTFADSFRAPSLSQISPASSQNILRSQTVQGVSSTVLTVTGPSFELDPETAQSFTLGFDFTPSAYPGFRLGATYFNIDYTDRIAVGDSTAGAAPRASPAAWPDVIFQTSSAPVVEALLRSTTNVLNTTTIPLSDPQTASAALVARPDFWVLDLRTRNLSLSKLDGMDVELENRFETSWGAVTVGAQFTRFFDYRQQVSASAPILQVSDTVLRPIDFRGRASIGLSRGMLDSTLGVNYSDDYSNPFALGGVQSVQSWTTLDWRVACDLDRGPGILDGMRLSLSVQNLLDRDPPLVASSGLGGGAVQNPVGFDPANANPLGRLVILGISKTW